MTREEKEEYLRKAIDFKRETFLAVANGTKPDPSITDFFSALPRSLFKYRSFDQYTCEMIEERYLYLCPAEQLDDPFECAMNLDITKYFDPSKMNINFDCYKMIVDMALQFVPSDCREKFCDLIRSCTNDDYTLNRRKAFDVLKVEWGDLPDANISMLIDNIDLFLNRFQSPEIQGKISGLVNHSANARKEVGICSLTENPRSQVMWAMYGNNYQGYCIEYDFEHDLQAAIDTFPVVYEDGRSNNVVEAVLKLYANEMADELTENAIHTDKTFYYRMLLTKNEEWAFQDEWRVIGDAGVKIKAPRIKTIYIGHKAKQDDLDMILQLSESQHFEVYRTKVNMKTLGLDFERIN